MLQLLLFSGTLLLLLLYRSRLLQQYFQGAVHPYILEILCVFLPLEARERLPKGYQCHEIDWSDTVIKDSIFNTRQIFFKNV